MQTPRNAIAAIALSAGFLAGCNTASLQDAAPTAAAVAPADESDDAPRDTGTYPNLNVKPGAAAAQLSDGETASSVAALKAAQSGQGASGGASPAEIARLKKLAKSHGKDALDEIEK